MDDNIRKKLEARTTGRLKIILKDCYTLLNAYLEKESIGCPLCTHFSCFYFKQSRSEARTCPWEIFEPELANTEDAICVTWLSQQTGSEYPDVDFDELRSCDLQWNDAYEEEDIEPCRNARIQSLNEWIACVKEVLDGRN